MKAAILLTAAGTADAPAAAALADIGRLVVQRHPGTCVRWAITERAVRNALAAQGVTVDAPEDALAGLRQEGFTHVAVQPLHVVPGAALRRLHAALQARRAGPDPFVALQAGAPLLNTDEDARRTVQAVLADLPVSRQPDEGVILVAHGSREAAAQVAYAAVARALDCQDGRVLLGSTVGWPDRAHAVRWCAATGVRRVYLLPFTVTAGRTALAALAPEGAASWLAPLRAAGVVCSGVPRGLAEYPGVVELWLEHLDRALGSLLKAHSTYDAADTQGAGNLCQIASIW